MTHLEALTAVLWVLLHAGGAVALVVVWRRYRQKFFVWSAANRAAQALGVVVSEMFPRSTTRIVCMRVLVGATGALALYYTFRLLGRRRTATVVSEKDGTIVVHDGVETYAVRTTTPPPPPDEDKIDTPRPAR